MSGQTEKLRDELNRAAEAATKAEIAYEAVEAAYLAAWLDETGLRNHVVESGEPGQCKRFCVTDTMLFGMQLALTGPEIKADGALGQVQHWALLKRVTDLGPYKAGKA